MPDTTSTTSQNVIKPKDWKQQIIALANDLVNRALVADASFMINSIRVSIDSVNPDRFDTFFEYQRTGIARISSTTACAGFYFGSN
jgi:phage tail sheath gpL-like